MNRIILLEGLPGTGKTTNSYRLFEQLVRNGRDILRQAGFRDVRIMKQWGESTYTVLAHKEL